MSISCKLNLVALHVAAALGTSPTPLLPKTVLTPKILSKLRQAEHTRKLNLAMNDPNSFIIYERPDMSEVGFLITPDADTRFSTGPTQKRTAPKKLNNGLDPRLHHG